MIASSESAICGTVNANIGRVTGGDLWTRKFIGIIKTVQTDQYSDTDRVNKARESRIIVVPDPTTADADDDFGFTTTIDFFEDSKKYNVTKDTDE